MSLLEYTCKLLGGGGGGCPVCSTGIHVQLVQVVGGVSSVFTVAVPSRVKIIISCHIPTFPELEITAGQPSK